MNRWCYIVLSVVAYMSVYALAPASANHSSVEAYLEEWRKDNAVPGLAVAVLDGDDEETWFLGGDGNGEPMASSTPFVIGSVAKTFTGTIVLQLADEGLVSLDDPARRHLAWIDLTPRFDSCLITPPDIQLLTG